MSSLYSFRVTLDLLVKVGDFGLARDLYSSDYYRATSESAALPVKWMAPEVFNDRTSSEMTDVVSGNVSSSFASLFNYKFPVSLRVFHYRVCV